MNDGPNPNSQDPRRRPTGSGGETPPPRSRIPNWAILGILLAIGLWYAYAQFWPSEAERIEIPYSAMIEAVENGHVVAVEISGQNVTGTLTDEFRWTGQELLAPGEPLPVDVLEEEIETSTEFDSTLPFESDDSFTQSLLNAGVQVSADADSGSILPQLLFSFLPLMLFIAIIFFIGRNMMRGQQNVFRFGSSKAKMYDAERPQVTFDDMAGEDEAKRELSEVVDFLKHPMKYHQLGAKLPRGVLLVGPPGTGKTLLGRAVAGEAGVPFYSVSASEFVEMFVGVGASRVRDLFNKAKASSPAIVFVDELDAVGRQRFAGLGGSNDEREQTLNQLLVEMDGFDDRQEVIVLAATNRPDVLDPALLRPGRFDRQVTIGLPDRRGREEIFKIHTRGIPISDDVNLERLAAGTPGFSGADVANLVNEAALTAARNEHKVVTTADFNEALDKIILGTARSPLVNERERLVVAYHEAGHAIVGHYSEGSDPLRKISIVPRGRALGVVIQTPDEDRYNYSRTYLLSRMATAMGGRAAEELIFNEMTTGAQNDIKEATTLARRMVGLWGMSEEIGPVYLGTGEEHVFLGREIAQHDQIGDRTQDRADEAVRDLVVAAQIEANRILLEHREELDILAERLTLDETLDQDQITEILGTPGVPDAVPADDD
ncbi:ATP-dependent zinc metalloprotease FtsH [soil metagenome]